MITEHVAQWTNWQREQFRLCDFLERIAERLPLVEVRTCEEATAAMAVLSPAHTYAEKELFPVLEARSSQIVGVLSLFRSHHAEDREEAERITSLLTRFVEGGVAEAASELKTRLPLFIRALRRNIQFEEAICRALFAAARSSSDESQSTRRMAS